LTIRHQHIAENLFLYIGPTTDARKDTIIMPSLRQIYPKYVKIPFLFF